MNLTTVVILLVGILGSSGVLGKDLAFKGKGKLNEVKGRQELCQSICGETHNPKEKKGKVNPWNDSHQICACWDNAIYRTNIEKQGCEARKDLPVFLFQGEVFTCNRMCKKFITDVTDNDNLALREAFMCSVKMTYGWTSACICDFKFE